MVYIVPSSLRIISGRDAYTNEFPYVVRLETRVQIHMESDPGVETLNVHACTCSVLTPLWTLTAAHCKEQTNIEEKVKSKDPIIRRMSSHWKIVNMEYLIRYGSPTGAPTNELSRISPVLQTERLSSKRPLDHTDDDILLLRTEPIGLPQYGKLSAVDFSSLYGHEILAMGYGITNGSDSTLANTLVLEKPLQIVKGMLKKCNEPYDWFPNMCVVQACGRHSAMCSGDSGGPVVHPSGIVAVNALAPVYNNCQMGDDDYRTVEFGVLVPVSAYVDWITEVLNRNSTI